jgi:hypothetical protein
MFHSTPDGAKNEPLGHGFRLRMDAENNALLGLTAMLGEWVPPRELSDLVRLFHQMGHIGTCQHPITDHNQPFCCLHDKKTPPISSLLGCNTLSALHRQKRPQHSSNTGNNQLIVPPT